MQRVRVRRFVRVRTLVVGALVLGMSGCSGGSGKAARLGNDAIASAEVVASIGPDRAPVDAAPGPDGNVIYLTANGTAGPAVLSVPATGGTPTTLATGDPFERPYGLAVATDGSRVFVADMIVGKIFTVPSGGGTATVVAGSEGRSPRGLDVTVVGGADVVYFTGTDPADGAPGLFSIPAAGGTVSVVAKGAPLVTPDAVVVAGDGVAYVTDQGPGGATPGVVYKVSGGKPVKLAQARLGSPGGVSITADGKTLFVSSQQEGTNVDQLLLVDLASGKTGSTTKIIGANRDSSGGLHRAYRTTRFAWADVSRRGRVYRVDP